MSRPASVHRKYALLLAVAVAATIPYGWHAASSLALGGGIQALNLVALERSVRVITGLALRSGERLAKTGPSIAVLRFALFMAAVLAVLAVLPVQPYAFLAGLLLALPAVTWHALGHQES